MQLHRQLARAPQASLASQATPCDPCRISENPCALDWPQTGELCSGGSYSAPIVALP